MDLSRVVWRKSSRSEGGGTECVEIATDGVLRAVRDSKNPDGGVLLLNAPSWTDFLGEVKAGAYDL